VSIQQQQGCSHASLVTSAAGANGDGYGALIAFDIDGKPLGVFSDDSRIADPRGPAVDRDEGLLRRRPCAGARRADHHAGSKYIKRA
jgi:hypothetical protein